MEKRVECTVYFPNLNGLRFIAAFLVIIHHVEQLKFILDMKNNWDNPFILVIGKLGVILFFVLSGFLITYLLLEEKSKTNTINIKNFYVRRIYRIWSLYYTILFLGFFILPFFTFFNMGEWSEDIYDNFGWKILLFLLFLPNLAGVMFPPVPYISQSWSIGVEEQFYCIWPILVKKLTIFSRC